MSRVYHKTSCCLFGLAGLAVLTLPVIVALQPVSRHYIASRQDFLVGVCASISGCRKVLVSSAPSASGGLSMSVIKVSVDGVADMSDARKADYISALHILAKKDGLLTAWATKDAEIVGASKKAAADRSLKKPKPGKGDA